jgi:fucose 4-O-acetylase-like acetyltransferase
VQASTLSAFVSQKFKFWSFVSMVLLVFVHGYNLEMRYLQPWTLPGEALTFTSFTEYFLANGLFRFRIPMLFIISGYLYALHDATPNTERIGKRVHSLLTPYLLWSAFGIILTYVFELSTWGSAMIADSGVVQIDETRKLIHDYHWYEVLGRWTFFPVSYQLWFIRVLLIYNLAYPAIRWCVLHKIARWIFFSIVFLMWLATFGIILIEGEGLLFFSLGVLIQKKSFSIESLTKILHPAGWGIAFVLLAACKTWLAFTGFELMGESVFFTLMFLHKATIISGLITCWFGLDWLVRIFMNMNWFVKLSSFSFIIYAMHAPLVAYLINPMFSLLNNMIGYRMITFIVLPLLVIMLCISTGYFLRRFIPKVYSVLTGGRGF